MAGRQLFVLLLYCLVFSVKAYERDYYTAAVYEHNSVLNLKPQVPLDRQSALNLMNKNLDIYQEQVAIASKQGVQIIVFPEDGIHGLNYSRESIYHFLETIPDPRSVKWNPCLEPQAFNNTEVLQRLSCMAKEGRMYLVANMPDKQPCNSDPHCPSDGRYQFNTDVVFSDDGTLVARYHKQNLFFEFEFDTPREVEHVVFDTPFAGKFGVFTCFDLLFYEPAVSLIEKHAVQQIVFPSAWMNTLPLLTAIQSQRAFATAFNINFLAANLHHPILRMTGSGIYSPSKSVYYHNEENEEGKLLVAELPISPTKPQTDQVLRMESHLDSLKSSSPLVVTGKESHQHGLHCAKEEEGQCQDLPDPATLSFHAKFMSDNYTITPLTELMGNLQVCYKSLCCYLTYELAAAHKEQYALVVFDGPHKVKGKYYIQVCALIKCAGPGLDTCGVAVREATSIIDFKLWGNFSAKHIFPEILASKMTLDLPDSIGWENNTTYHMSKKGMTSGLITAGLYGRWYEKDRLRLLLRS
ncbi:biotinidase [Latimeria chalumnae]|uniref:biotinidase n=1 Tax=Latimeria chalumnae TaxID=7897 RepID=UPI00313BFB99